LDGGNIEKKQESYNLRLAESLSEWFGGKAITARLIVTPRMGLHKAGRA